MGCTSEKSVPINMIKKYSDISDNEINIDLHDIEKQGESKHPKIEEKNLENIEIEENNYYNYNLDELISVNTSKMRVKRIENFDNDESDDESDNESSNGSVEENKSIETDEKENINNHIDENENKMIENNTNDKNKMNKAKNREDKKPEDKKPPNIEKLKKKGKEKIEINLFN